VPAVCPGLPIGTALDARDVIFNDSAGNMLGGLLIGYSVSAMAYHGSDIDTQTQAEWILAALKDSDVMMVQISVTLDASGNALVCADAAKQAVFKETKAQAEPFLSRASVIELWSSGQPVDIAACSTCDGLGVNSLQFVISQTMEPVATPSAAPTTEPTIRTTTVPTLEPSFANVITIPDTDGPPQERFDSAVPREGQPPHGSVAAYVDNDDAADPSDAADTTDAGAPSTPESTSGDDTSEMVPFPNVSEVSEGEGEGEGEVLGTEQEPASFIDSSNEDWQKTVTSTLLNLVQESSSVLHVNKDSLESLYQVWTGSFVPVSCPGNPFGFAQDSRLVTPHSHCSYTVLTPY